MAVETSIVDDWPLVKDRPQHKLCRAIHQLYGYMAFNNLWYSILTNYANTWFLRRVHIPGGDALEVTDAFHFSNNSTLLEAMVVLAEEECFHASPMQSPAAAPQREAPAPPSPDPPSPCRLQVNVEPITIGLEPLQGVARSRVGVIMKGKYLGQNAVDASKDLSSTEELDEEARVYEALQSLQGTVLVHAIAYLEDFGINIAERERLGGDLHADRDLCNTCLTMVNVAGFSHEDVKPENFLIKSGTVRLIDFGQSKRMGGRSWQRSCICSSCTVCIFGDSENEEVDF
ncbi:hypothetical protein BDK51DRAFT_34728 [Blyttiomyces helicus]|uniref:Protein kinase domain-containing protein n=1 Tax=Blyttiomyces helicus TaxID=388810 RepID=A0A4P9W564_9FUNG|nr:hypothetical protein BDK51DRAFT_34728 [Blyttiomyces helicus]|eukprot:RKO87529.1 hypothetical protein BDK51DRAFT_34728 [Blyttiomyces helicus]